MKTTTHNIEALFGRDIYGQEFIVSYNSDLEDHTVIPFIEGVIEDFYENVRVNTDGNIYLLLLGCGYDPSTEQIVFHNSHIELKGNLTTCGY